MNSYKLKRTITGETNTIGGKRLVSVNSQSSYTLKIPLIGDLLNDVNKNIQSLHEHIDTVREARELIRKGKLFRINKSGKNETSGKKRI